MEICALVISKREVPIMRGSHEVIRERKKRKKKKKLRLTLNSGQSPPGLRTIEKEEELEEHPRLSRTPTLEAC